MTFVSSPATVETIATGSSRLPPQHHLHSLSTESFGAAAILRSALESVASEVCIQLLVVLLLLLVTLQLLLDTQAITVASSQSCFSNSSSVSSEVSSRSLLSSLSLTSQFQYAIALLSVVFFIESCSRLVLRRGLSTTTTNWSRFTNWLDFSSCIAYAGSSITFAALTYTGTVGTNQELAVIRDALNYLAALRLVRVSLIVRGLTNRLRLDLEKWISTKQDESTMLRERISRLEKRINERQSGNAAAKEPSTIHRSRQSTLGDRDEVVRSNETADKFVQNQNEGLTPEAEAVIQRLYELGLAWEADPNELVANIGLAATVDNDAEAGDRKLPEYFANMPTTTL